MELTEWSKEKHQSLSMPKVLVADDDEATRILLRVAIVPWGYKVVEAKDGEEAWEILQKSDPPQILILDWLMPKLDGVALCKRINEELESRPYIIFLTRMTGTENVIQGLEAGADEFMLKPFDLSELRIRIFAGERIIKYRNQLTEQNKILQNYVSDMKSLAEEHAKQVIPFSDLSTVLQEVHNELAAVCDNLMKKNENEEYVKELRDLQGKLNNIIDIIRGFQATPIKKEDITRVKSVPKTEKTTSIIDMDRMHAFFGNDANAIQEFIKTFITLSSDHLREIEKAIKNKNSKSAKYFFHLLGSASGNSGIMKMYDLCGKAEEHISKNNWDVVMDCYHSLVEMVKRLEKENIV
jgi:DNA-binding response OmpR family regulator/HPt (histidine-containing phosphotransfer) domain-containing protein